MAELTIVQELAVPPTRVWRAWTDPHELAAWLWPSRFDTAVTLDPAVGGRFRVQSAPMEMGVSGEYLRFDEPTTAEFTWRWDGEVEQSRVVLTLEPPSAGCTLKLHHGGFLSDQVRDDHLQGWQDCLGRLAQNLDRNP